MFANFPSFLTLLPSDCGAPNNSMENEQQQQKNRSQFSLFDACLTYSIYTSRHAECWLLEWSPWMELSWSSCIVDRNRDIILQFVVRWFECVRGELCHIMVIEYTIGATKFSFLFYFGSHFLSFCSFHYIIKCVWRWILRKHGKFSIHSTFAASLSECNQFSLSFSSLSSSPSSSSAVIFLVRNSMRLADFSALFPSSTTLNSATTVHCGG